ncbi:MAG: TetR/AcrR family transcriptional regulator [Desulfobacterales bacterium CG07_land_8_20_14_0_80_52_14]|nr:MAG: TetR family transcriptional regulator [Desulfobacterales bacterium CG23_combo_of_CG06-09_8_20_14_all_52_9]PIU49113.1 MAG: TetR/AcrR family transcriptional regulator [Desulfobacterales bacterium CG07_land_8_20_14_0_80_52_14]
MGIQERKEREREQRRQQIMVAALRVFSAKGFNKSTMEDIATEAELSPGTLYLYFRNKDELFASLSLRMLQFLNIRLEKLGKDRNLSVKKKYQILKQALYDVYDFDPLVLINMFHLQSSETLKNLSDELIEEIKALSRKSLRAMAGIFDEGIKQKLFIERHPTAMADSLWALFSGMVLWEESKKIIDGGKDYLKPTLDLAFEIFWRGIQA